MSAPTEHAETRHARGTPPSTHGPRSLPRERVTNAQKCARRHTRTLAVRAAPQRERRSEPDSRTGPRFRKPRRGHPAAIIEEFRRLARCYVTMYLAYVIVPDVR